MTQLFSISVLIFMASFVSVVLAQSIFALMVGVSRSVLVTTLWVMLSTAALIVFRTPIVYIVVFLLFVAINGFSALISKKNKQKTIN